MANYVTVTSDKKKWVAFSCACSWAASVRTISMLAASAAALLPFLP